MTTEPNNPTSTCTVDLTWPLATLTFILVALKVSGAIAWSWWWVLAPLWIPFAIFAGVMLVVAALLAVFRVKRSRQRLKQDFEIREWRRKR